MEQAFFMYYVGGDVHWERSRVRILDGSGAMVERRTIAGSWEDLIAFLTDFGAPMAVC